jgi:hypothetical protein
VSHNLDFPFLPGKKGQEAVSVAHLPRIEHHGPNSIKLHKPAPSSNPCRADRSNGIGSPPANRIQDET